MKVGGQAGDLKLRHEIVFVGEIANGPDEARRGDFGFGFGAQFHFPFLAGLVSHDELGIGAGEVFLYEIENCALGRVAFAAWAEAEIARGDVSGVLPEDGRVTGSFFRGLRDEVGLGAVLCGGGEGR